MGFVFWCHFHGLWLKSNNRIDNLTFRNKSFLAYEAAPRD